MPKPNLLAAVLCAATCLTQPARAEITVDQAHALETQLRDWLVGLVAPAIDPGPRPIHVSPAGDRFRLEVQPPDSLAQQHVIEPGLAVTLDAAQTQDGRWTLENLHWPSPLRLKLPAHAGSKAPPTTWEGTIESQSFHAVFDPSFTTPSSFDAELTGFRTKTAGTNTFVAHSTNKSVWQPAGEGRIDVLLETTDEGVDSHTVAENGTKVSYAAGRWRSVSRVRNLSPANLATFIRAVAALVPALTPDVDQLTAPQRALAHKVVAASQDIMAGMTGDFTINDLRVDASGHKFQLHGLSTGVEFGVPEGKTTLSVRVAADGFESAEIPKGVLRDYVPRRIIIRPRISGLPADRLIDLAQRAIDADAKGRAALQAEAAAMALGGNVIVSMDELVVDLGPADLTGHGSVTINGPDQIDASAQLTAKGLDGLIKRANTDPSLKQATPVLIFLKGMGAQNGDATVWNIAYAKGHLTINDNDISGMIPGGMSPPK